VQLAFHNSGSQYFRGPNSLDKTPHPLTPFPSSLSTGETEEGKGVRG
jgi:hypothetical protein